MLLHYWTTARRFFLRHLSFSLINLFGLSIGIAACLLIWLYVRFELTYDRYNVHADRIARVTTLLHSPEADMPLATSPVSLAGELARESPALEAAVRLEPAEIDLRKDGEQVKEDDFYYSEQSLFAVFSFSFLEGRAADALVRPNSIVLTKSMARKYFGGSPALGRVLTGNTGALTVTAVVKDRPANSDIKINAWIAKDFDKSPQWSLNDLSAYTFVLFRGRPDPRSLNAPLSAISARYLQPELEREGAAGYRVTFETEALADLHFSRDKLVDTPKGSRSFNKIFSALAAFILIIALLNYINLSTAKASERAREVGVRKAVGATPSRLIQQFLAESFCLMALACILAVGLVIAAIPFFNRTLSTSLALENPGNFLLPALIFPVTSLLAGAYPAFILSRFSPLKVLKNGRPDPSKGVGLRKVLTVMQFMIALAMLAGTILIFSQMRFIDHKDLGADRSQVTTILLPGDSLSTGSSIAFSETLRQETGVLGVSMGSGMPVGGAALTSVVAWSGGRKREFLCNCFFIDPQFLPLMHIPLRAGRNLSDRFPSDKKKAFLVNEAFVQSMGWTSGIDSSIDSDRKGKIVGVTRNFFFKSLHNAIEPAIMIYNTNPPVAALVKASPGKLPRIREIWKQYFPTRPFDYYFMDASFAEQYKKDRVTLRLFNAFTILAVVISGLGLYGLISLVTTQRTREIGIRKVLGASLSQIVSLFTTGLLILIAWASLIALPLAAIGMHRWLSSYAYHVPLNVWMFLLPVGGLLTLALAVTALRIVRAALANPVKSLRAD